MKKKIIICAVAAALVIGMCAAYFTLKPEPAAGIKTINIEVVHLSGDVNEFPCSTDAEYLRQALDQLQLVSGREDQYGLWIETVDGETADASKEEWWGYTVNGETAMYGVDQQVIADGDKIVFTLNVGYDIY